MCVRYVQPAHAPHHFHQIHFRQIHFPQLPLLQEMDSSSSETSSSTTTMRSSFCKHRNIIQICRTSKKRTSSNTTSPTVPQSPVRFTACRMPTSRTASSACWCMPPESPTKCTPSTSATTTKETRAVLPSLSTLCSARLKHVLSNDVLI